MKRVLTVAISVLVGGLTMLVAGLLTSERMAAETEAGVASALSQTAVATIDGTEQAIEHQVLSAAARPSSTLSRSSLDNRGSARRETARATEKPYEPATRATVTQPTRSASQFIYIPQF